MEIKSLAIIFLWWQNYIGKAVQWMNIIQPIPYKQLHTFAGDTEMK